MDIYLAYWMQDVTNLLTQIKKCESKYKLDQSTHAEDLLFKLFSG